MGLMIWEKLHVATYFLLYLLSLLDHGRRNGYAKKIDIDRRGDDGKAPPPCAEGRVIYWRLIYGRLLRFRRAGDQLLICAQGASRAGGWPRARQ